MNIFEDFRTYKFKDNDIDKYVIESIYNNSLLNKWNKETLHTKILTYMVSKNERDINKYLSYLKRSQPITIMQLNCKAIENKVKNEIREMKELIASLEENQNEIQKM